jgi:putative membrane protein
MDFGYQLTGIGLFAAYFVLALVLTGIYLKVYTWITPHDELELIRKGVPAAALALGGSLIGFCIPLASAIENSVNLLDCLLWGFIALLVQIAVYKITNMVLKDVAKKVEEGHMASGISLATFSIAAGILNAACMTY